MILERDVERRLVSAVETRLGGVCLKVIPDDCAGMPDRLCILPCGRVVWVELKRPSGGRVSQVQMYRHKQLRELGHDVRVVRSREDVDRLIDELM